MVDAARESNQTNRTGDNRPTERKSNMNTVKVGQKFAINHGALRRSYEVIKITHDESKEFVTVTCGNGSETMGGPTRPISGSISFSAPTLEGASVKIWEKVALTRKN